MIAIKKSLWGIKYILILGLTWGVSTKTSGQAMQRIDSVYIQKEVLRRSGKLGGLAAEQVNDRYIRRQAGGSLMESLADLPGVQAMSIGAGQAKPMIRGLGFNQVLVVEQGIRHEGQEWGVDHGLEIDQYGVKSVQIVKGPAAFRYGSGAIGGVVVLDTEPAKSAAGAGGSLDLIGKSNNGLYGGSVSLWKRTEKQWFWDARLTAMNHGDYRVPADTVYIYSYAAELDGGKVRNTAGRETAFRLRGGYEGRSVRSTLTVSAYSTRFGFFANAHGLEPRQVDTDLHDRSNRDIQLPRQSVRHLKIGSRTEWELRQRQDHFIQMDLSIQHNFRQEHSAYVNHGYMPPVLPETLPFESTLERQYDKTTYSASISDRWTRDRHEIHMGIQTDYQDNRIGGWNYLSPALRQFTGGVYIYDEYQINAATALTAAARYDIGRISTEKYQDWFSSEYVDPEGNIVQEHMQRAAALDRRFAEWTWASGLRHTFGKWNLQTNLGSAFRLPSAKELAANGVNYHYFRYEQGNPDLSPEKSVQLDVGTTWADHRWHLQLQPFVHYFSNYIYLNPTSMHDYQYGAGNQVFQYTQAEVFRWGGEFQANFTYNRHWDGGITGEFVSSRQLSGAKKGYTLPFSPAPTLMAHLRYQPAAYSWSGLKNPFIMLEYQIRAAQNRIVPTEKSTPGSRVMNLALGSSWKWGDREIELGLRIQNLWNTKYYNHLSFYRLIDLPEMGRNVVLSLHIPFNTI